MGAVAATVWSAIYFPPRTRHALGRDSPACDAVSARRSPVPRGAIVSASSTVAQRITDARREPSGISRRLRDGVYRPGTLHQANTDEYRLLSATCSPIGVVTG